MVARLDPTQVQVLLIDVQPLFIESISGDWSSIKPRLEQMILMTDWMQLPLTVTSELPLEDKGSLPEDLKSIAPDQTVYQTKNSFDAMGESLIRTTLSANNRQQVVVAGTETDVCVLLTCLGLRQAGYEVFLLTDCIFSSAKDVTAALERFDQAAVTPLTLKTFYYEMTGTLDRSLWPDGWSECFEKLRDLHVDPESLAN